MAQLDTERKEAREAGRRCEPGSGSGSGSGTSRGPARGRGVAPQEAPGQAGGQTGSPAGGQTGSPTGGRAGAGATGGEQPTGRASPINERGKSRRVETETTRPEGAKPESIKLEGTRPDEEDGGKRTPGPRARTPQQEPGGQVRRAELARRALASKWPGDQATNLRRLLSPCAFCVDAWQRGSSCAGCLCPPQVCSDDGEGGLVGEAARAHGNCFLFELPADTYEAIRQALAALRA